jgi:hypothetical protein
MTAERDIRVIESLLVSRARQHAKLEALLDSRAARTRTDLVRYHRLTEECRKLQRQLAAARAAESVSA